MAGATIELPSVILRGADLRILGNGQGAVSTQGYLAELPSLIADIDAGRFEIATRSVPLVYVEAAWLQPDIGRERVVLVP